MQYNIRSTLKSVLLWRLASLILGFGFVLAIPILIDPRDFGQYNLILSIAQVSASALLIWPNTGFLRYGREELHKSSSIEKSLSGRVVLHALLSLVYILLVIVVLPHVAIAFGLETMTAIVGVLSIALLQATAEIGILALQAKADFSSFNLGPILQRSGQLFGIGLIYFGSVYETKISSLYFLLFGTALGFFASGINAWRRVEKRFTLQGTLKQCGRIVGHSWTLPIISTSAYTIAWVDLWMINAMRGTSLAGQYSFAYLVTTVASAILVPVVAGLLPSSIDSEVQADEASHNLFGERAFSIVQLMGALLPVGIALAFSVLFFVPMGDYSDAKTPLLVLGSGIIFQLGVSLGEVRILARAELTRRYTLIVLAMVAVNAGLNYLLIPLIGLSGAAFATCATYGSGMILQWRLIGLRTGLIRLCSYTAMGVSVAAMFVMDFYSAAFICSLLGSGLLMFLGRSRGYFRPAVDLLPPIPAIRWIAGNRNT